jgi:hypothetical protein
MLSRLFGLTLLSPTLWLAACSPPAPSTTGKVESPLAIEASYRLLFNEQLVGIALFELEIAEDGNYRIDAFTTPAGQMEDQSDDEVLETSLGRLEAGAIRPERFEHSVMQGGLVELVSLAFDWKDHRLHVEGKDARRDVVLLPGTHDRLSYLLEAHRLAAAGEGTSQIQIASTDATEETVLEVVGKGPLEVPSGRYEALSIRRLTPAPGESRQLWFDTRLGPLPLRVLHEHGGNAVDMQLEQISGRPNDPR